MKTIYVGSFNHLHKRHEFVARGLSSTLPLTPSTLPLTKSESEFVSITIIRTLIKKDHSISGLVNPSSE